MKKILLLGAMLTLLSTTCFANISTSEMALGGITLDSSTEYVKRIYGNPTKIENVNNQYANSTTFKYGKTFIIEFLNGKVNNIITKANNGISTPSGIHVGSNINEVKRIYGAPDFNEDHLRNRKDIITYRNRLNENSKAYDRYMQIHIKKGKVAEIYIKWAPLY